ncbi:putative leucine-rich repeat-containing protein DDB_G0290503 [Drosophila montana]|uniref:putative leucine-rich repeat-containing protein DDB_G0290503 n=1 Tax=Drosophila montana TaxID=40370 RepID=UPI00313EE5D4
MFLMTSLQFLLLLLSASLQMEAFRYYDYDDNEEVNFRSNAHGYGRAVTTRTACESHGEIARWINEQVVRNAKLTSFNQHLGKLLNALNTKRPEQIGDEHCCFYEKDTMEKILKDMTSLSASSGIGVGKPLESSGDIGKDLDSILDRMKMLIGKDTKTCCDQLTDNLKAMEADLVKQLDELSRKLNEQNEDNTKQRDELKDKQADLEKKLKDIAQRIEQLEQNQKDNKAEAEKCCKELNSRVDDLNQQLEKAQAETQKKANELKKELKDLQDKQKEQQDQINNIKMESEKRIGNIKLVKEKCDKTSEINKVESKLLQGNSTENNPLLKIIRLENVVNEHKEHLVKFVKVATSISHCRRFNDELKQMEAKVQELEQQKTPEKQPVMNNCPGLDELKAEVKRAKACCKNMDKLSQDLEQLQQDVDKMGANYSDHIAKLEAALKDLQQRLNEALDKLSSASSTTVKPTTDGIDAQAVDALIKQLQAKLAATNDLLSVIQKNLDDNDNKLNQIKDDLIKKYDELDKRNAERQKEAQEFKNQAEQRLNDLEKLLLRLNNNNNHNAPAKLDGKIVQRLEELEKHQKKLRKDTDKILELEQRIAELEARLKDALENLHENDSELNKCLSSCKGLDKLDDLIDRIEDLEKIAGIPPKARSPTNPTSPTTRWTTTRRPHGSKGSVDSAMPIYEPLK